MQFTYLGLTIGALVVLAACSPQIVKQEPKPGALRTGEIILVDDGSCPAGQVKEVTGGTPTQDRGRRCVPGPE